MSTVRLTTFSRSIIVLAILISGIFAVKHLAPGTWNAVFPRSEVKESAVPPKANLPDIDAHSAAGSSATAAVNLPGSVAGCANLPEVRYYLWAWNAQMGLMFANGGPQAAEGSLMCARQVNLKLIREDNPGKMQEGLVAFATELKSGVSQPKKGAAFVAIMGDGAAAFLKGLNDTLGRLGDDYTAKVVGSAGYSRGEDKFMGPPEWRSNPASSRGGLVTAVLRDGDWNIAMKWLGDNGLCNNPDETTYDPDCLNWVSVDDYIDAAQKYVAGYCEDRPVVSKGRRTSATRKVCVNGVATWTPGDVIVAQEKGGLVSIVSTREYRSQMPNTIIGIDRWMRDNRSTVEGMLGAIMEGGDAVKSSPAALRRGAEISHVVYNESGTDPDYWVKYFAGTVEKDKQGLMVELGGSSVNNLADNLQTFGLAAGSANLFAATYTVFGNLVVSQYPALVPDFPAVDKIVDTSYLEALVSATRATTLAEMPVFEAAEKVERVVSRKAWNITFETSSARFTPDAERLMQQLFDDLVIAGGTLVEVHGHTDNLGDFNANMRLSEARAFAVKEWLEHRSPANFGPGRLRVFSHGPTQPAARNETDEGRAINRRVDIIIGTTGPE